ncbi:MAG: helix-turn-helix transcriptional regulator [Hyphomicrobiaceae bacterium]|nr:helix-turn-helix transcriptional regulator [Hyphomicrobiaceae bacterium]
MPERANPIDRDGALALIRAALIERKMTQAELADAADCHEKTVQNLLAGRSVREQTLFDVAMVLGLDYQKIREAWTAAPGALGPVDRAGTGGHVAPVYMGAYTRAAVDHVIGDYVTLRPSFSRTGVIAAYRTVISWDGEWPSLVFEESERPDAAYQHRGRIYVPASSMFIHLVSLTKGAMRMIVLSQLDQGGRMRGIISTQTRQGAVVQPVAAPIVFCQRHGGSPSAFGEIDAAHASFTAYAALLAETTTEGYARFVPGV